MTKHYVAYSVKGLPLSVEVEAERTEDAIAEVMRRTPSAENVYVKSWAWKA